MKRNESNNLFELICEMTKSEKRFFKLSTQKHYNKSGNVYIKLFNRIESQKEYNEKNITEYFKNESWIKRIHIEKYNLYKILLRTLNDYHYGMTVDNQITEGILNAKILYSKMLYVQAYKVIKTVKNLAIKFDKYPLLLEILETERNCLYSLPGQGIVEKELPLLYKESKQAIEIFKDLTNYIGLFKDIMIEKKMYFTARNKTEKQRLQKILKGFDKRDKYEESTFEADIRKNNLLSLYSVASGNIKDGYKYSTKVIKKFEKNPDRIQENPERYVTNLYNLIMRCDLLKKKSESELYSDKVINIYSQYKIKENRIVNYLTMRLEMYKVNRCIRYTEINEGYKLINEIEDWLKKKNKLINSETEILFYYNAAYLFFIGNELKKALGYVNKILNKNKQNYRSDVFGFTRILNLIIHYKLGNTDLLTYVIKSTYRFWKKNKILNKTELVIYKYMNSILLKVNDFKELTVVLNELKKELIIIFKDPFEARAVEFFDIISWIDSILEKKPFVEILRRNAN